VRSGDTLSSIARAFGTTARQLQAWNAERYPSLTVNPGII
jgi:LysM repeat protein